jgi:hypothetical protein
MTEHDFKRRLADHTLDAAMRGNIPGHPQTVDLLLSATVGLVAIGRDDEAERVADVLRRLLNVQAARCRDE